MTGGLTEDDRAEVALLRTLFDAARPLTLIELARSSGLSIDVARPTLGRLADAGCRFDHHPQLGVRLTESGLGVWRAWLAEALRWPLGRVHVYRATSSTQGRARDAGRPGLFVADTQTAGRGRQGRRWRDTAGSSLLFTLTLPRARHEAASHGPRLTAATAVALCDTVRVVAGVTPDLKWPNDLLLNGRKLAGVLVEGDTTWRIGVGLNVNHPDAPGDAASDETLDPAWLSDAAGRRLDRLPLLTEAVRRLTDWTDAARHAEAIARWRQHCVTLGQRLTFDAAGQRFAGDVIDVDPDAGLIVRRDSGELVHLPAATTRVA